MPNFSKQWLIDYERKRANQAGGVSSGAKPEAMTVAADIIWEEYLKTGSIHRACMRFCVSGETARQRLLECGFRLNRSKWSKAEVEELRRAYESPEGVEILPLSKRLSRSYAAIACKAEELGLTCDRGKQIRTESTRVNISKAQKARYIERPETVFDLAAYMEGKPHPKGMLGKHHTEEVRHRMSAVHKGVPVPRERTIRQMKTRVERYGSIAPVNARGSWRGAWREIGGKRKYFRSRWEANYARYLEFQKQHGLISEWDHEPETFWFEGIKRGVVSYLPDFKVSFSDGRFEYHEIKGWMDAASKTKIKRMAKYHPEIILKVFDGKWYKDNSKQLKGLIEGWE